MAIYRGKTPLASNGATPYVNPETNNSIPKQITMSKTPEIIQVLKNMSYSPTTITTYLKCSLRFYFSKG